MKCPHCNKTFNLKLKICPYCGKNMIELDAKKRKLNLKERERILKERKRKEEKEKKKKEEEAKRRRERWNLYIDLIDDEVDDEYYNDPTENFEESILGPFESWEYY